MTASLSTMTIDYYLQTAAGDGPSQDMTSYYVSSKTPAGRWFGSGVAGLNIDVGEPVSRHEALALFRDHADPATGQRLGRPVMKRRAAPENARTPSGKPAKSTRAGVHGFDMTFSPPKSVSALWALAEPHVQGEVYAAHQQAVSEALRWAEQNVIQSRSGHGGPAQVEVKGIAASLFDHWDSRNGDPQLHTHAVIVNKVQRTSDDQWVTIDSNTLYRHMVAISEKYNSLLFDRLHQRVGGLPQTRGASAVMTAEALMAAAESGDQQNTKAVDTSGVYRVELAGMPEDLIDEFSTRARLINEAADAMIAEHIQRNGRPPSNATILKYRQQATLASRQAKDTESDETLPEKMQRWRRRAINAGYSPEAVVRDAVGHPQQIVRASMVTDQVRDSLGSWVLNDASMRRTTFSRANIMASAERVTRLIRCQSAEQRDQIVSGVVEDALSKAVSLTPRRFPRYDSTAYEDPAVLNRGESVFEHRRTSGVFTTRQIMEEEEYLITQTQSGSAPVAGEGELIEKSLDDWRSKKGYSLSSDKFAAAREVLTSDARISAIIGPAGTGKTTTMSAITQTWQHAHGEGSVVGLAPSAVAAGVLADEIGVSTDNTAKWLYESVGPGAAARAEREARYRQRLSELSMQNATASRRDSWRNRKISELQAKLAATHAEQAKYQLRHGQLLIIDEASMVATPQMAELVSQAEHAGAKVLLVGDPAQLEAVEAGGFLGHMERNLEVSELNQVWRFTHQWEREASLGLRAGRESVADEYAAHDRLHGDSDTDAVDQAYSQWKADHDSGKSSLLIASDNQTVADLAQRAHVDRVEAGEVDIERSVPIRGGIEAGLGEILLARKNDRSLRDSSGEFVSNGTRLTVTGIRPDGSAEATVESNGATVTLDKGYLADSVELGYAVTAHRAQGVTVDTAHAVISPSMSRELFYVAMTRGQESNDAYIDSGEPDEPAVATWKGAGDGVVVMHEDSNVVDPVTAVKTVLARSQAEHTAQEVQDAQHGWANDLGRMIHERSYLLWAARTTRTQEWVRDHYSPEAAESIYSDADWQRLVSADPGLNHSGRLNGTETAPEILARCQQPSAPPGGPGLMLTPVGAATEAQASTLATLEEQITDQLAIRASEARTVKPEWYAALAALYPDGAVPQRDLDAVLIWRGASNQNDEVTALGKAPPEGDYLRPLWDRMQTTLRQRRLRLPDELDSRIDNLSHSRPVAEHDVPLERDEAMSQAWEHLTSEPTSAVPHTEDFDYWSSIGTAKTSPEAATSAPGR